MASCCQDESELVKVEADHTTVSPSTALVTASMAVALLIHPANVWLAQKQVQMLPFAGLAHAPPVPAVPRYQLFSTLLFFDDGEPRLA